VEELELLNACLAAASCALALRSELVRANSEQMTITTLIAESPRLDA
jgi:hypothetical protein